MSINLKREIKASVNVAVEGALGPLKNDLQNINKLIAALDRLSAKLEFRNAMDQAKEAKKAAKEAGEEAVKTGRKQKEAATEQEKAQKAVTQVLNRQKTGLEKLNDALNLNQKAYGKSAVAAQNANTLVTKFLNDTRNKAFSTLSPLDQIAAKIEFVRGIAKKGGITFQNNFKPLIRDLENLQQQLLRTQAAAVALSQRKLAIESNIRDMRARNADPSRGFAAFEARAQELGRRAERNRQVRENILNREARSGGGDSNRRLLSAGSVGLGVTNANTRYVSDATVNRFGTGDSNFANPQALAQMRAMYKEEEKTAAAAEKTAESLRKKAEATNKVSRATAEYRKHVPVLNREIEKQDSLVGKLLKSYNRLGFLIFQLQYSTLAITAALGVSQFTTMTDQYIQFENAIAIASSSQNEFAKGMQGVRDIARETFQDVDAVAKLYRSFATAAPSAGLNQDEVLKLTRNTSVLGAVSGSNTESLNAALYQFGQGINSDRFGGEELRSVSEQAQTLFRAIVAGYNEVNINEITPEMRRNFLEASKKGLIGQRELIAALLSEEVTAAAEMLQKNIRPTFAGVTQNLIGTFEKLFGTINNATNITGQYAKAVAVLDGALFDTPEKLNKMRRDNSPQQVNADIKSAMLELDGLTGQSLKETRQRIIDTKTEVARLNNEYIKNVENLRSFGNFLVTLGATIATVTALTAAYNAVVVQSSAARTAELASLGLGANASRSSVNAARNSRTADRLRTAGSGFSGNSLLDILAVTTSLGPTMTKTAASVNALNKSTTLAGRSFRLVSGVMGTVGSVLGGLFRVFGNIFKVVNPLVLVIGALSLIFWQLHKSSGTTFSMLEIVAGAFVMVSDVIGKVIGSIINTVTNLIQSIPGMDKAGVGVKGVLDDLGAKGRALIGSQRAPTPPFTGGGMPGGDPMASAREAEEAKKKEESQKKRANDFIQSILDQAADLIRSQDVFSQNAAVIAEKQKELAKEAAELAEDGAKNIEEFKKRGEDAITVLKNAQITRIIKDINNEIGDKFFPAVTDMVSRLVGGDNRSGMSIVSSQIQALREIGEKYLKDFSVADFIQELMGVGSETDLIALFNKMASEIEKSGGSDVRKQVEELFETVKGVARIVSDNELQRMLDDLKFDREMMLATAGMSSRAASRTRRDIENDRLFDLRTPEGRERAQALRDANAINDSVEDSMRKNPYYGLMKATNEYLDSITDIAGQVEQLVSGTLKSIEDELTNFLVGEDADFGKIFKNIGKEIMRMTVQNTVMKPMTEWIQRLTGKFFKPTGNPTVSVLGSQAVQTMSVNAGVVNIGGGGLGSLPDFTGGKKDGDKGFFGKIFDSFSGLFKKDGMFEGVGKFFGNLFGKNKGGSGGGKSGGGFWSTIGNFFASLFHSGGVVGMPSAMKAVSPAVFANAQRFHNGMNTNKLLGLANNEIPAILERGEVVLNRPQQARLISQMGGGTSGPVVNVNLNYNAADGNDGQDDAKMMASLVQAEIQKALVRERMQGGMLRGGM